MTSNFSSDPEAVLERETEEASCEPTPEALLETVYELKRCIAWIIDSNISRVCLQFPDSLLEDSVAVCQWIKKSTSKLIYILGDTSYGSCCVDIVAAEHVPTEGLIHFGPACLSNSSIKAIKSNIPVLYVFPKANCYDTHSVISCIKNEMTHSMKNIVNIFSCEYSHIQDEIQASLTEWQQGIVTTRLMTGEIGLHANPSSQGCCGIHCTSAKSQGEHQIVCLGRGFCLPEGTSIHTCDIVYIGREDAFLHSLLASIAVNSKSFTCISPEGAIYVPELNTGRIARRQLYLAQLVREASTIGLILASPGDPSLLPAAQHARKLLASRHPPPRVYSFAVGKPNPAKLANFQEVNLFVLLACPQHPLLAPATSQILSKEFYSPIVGLPEVELALNLARTTCGPDYRDILDGGYDFIPLEQSDEQPETDVSLLTGCLLKMNSDSLPVETSSSAICERATNWQLAELTGAKFLSERSWQGLDPALGADAPSVATKGLSGIASQYSSEPNVG